jgi:YegS/Rv2252/BmrU family lipid kinase
MVLWCGVKNMPELHAKVIVNPEAGSRSVGREWPHINRQLQRAGLSFDYEFTNGAGHAVDIASRAIDSGYHYLIAIGGDGTVNEVANGILRSSNPLSIILGVVSAGTAHAFSFSLGVAEDYTNSTNACSFLTDQRRALIDVGVVQCWNHGQSIERFFLNEASIGFSADIVDAWKSLPNRFGKSVNIALRTVAGYKCLAIHRNKRVRLQVGNEGESISICTVMVSNGQYCADRMLIAPHASLDDGLLNAVVVGDVSKLELLRIRPTLYDGSHVKHPKIREKKTTVVTIESDEHLLVEVDGDILGECPASFRVIPSALTVVVPRSRVT